MLNRTNRKLSAKNTGLKFGTREFAVKAGLNLGNLTRHFAARLESVRIGRVDVRSRDWSAPVAMRSYPAVSMRAPMPADSSPEPHPASIRGLAAGSVGQRAASASHPRACPSPVGAGQPRVGQPQAIPGLGHGTRRIGRLATARHLPLPRTLVPDAAS